MRNDLNRLCEFVDFGEQDECWICTKPGNNAGYATYHPASFDGRAMGAHRYVYWAVFGGLPHNKLVCHSCDVKRCVNPRHLHLGTKSSNALEAVERGQWGDRSLQGTNNPRAKLSVSDVKEIRKRYTSENTTQRELAEEFGMDQSHIGDIVNRKCWTHI